MHSSRATRTVNVLVVVAATACGGGSDGPSSPPVPIPPVTPHIAIAVTSAAPSIVPGTVGTASVTITRTNFTGPVSLAITGLPNGVATPATTAVSGNSATLVFAAGSAAPAGSSTVTITASGTGVFGAVATVPLTVTTLPGTRLSKQFCGAQSSLPLWVAAQDGDGVWRQLTREADETYTYGVTDRGGLAIASQFGSDVYSLSIFYGAVADFQHVQAQHCGGAGPKTVIGTVAGHIAGEAAQIAIGTGFTSVASPATAYSVSGVAEGLVDLVAFRRPLASPTPLKLIIRRAITPANGAALPAIDLAGTEAFDPDTWTATVTGLVAGERIAPTSQFRTSGGTQILLGAAAASTGTSTPYYAIPTARTVPGDVQLFSIVATESPTPPSPARLVMTMYRTPQDRTVALGPALGPVTVTVASSTPSVRLRTQYTRQAEYPGGVNLVFSQSPAGGSRTVFLQHMGGGTTFDVTMPDFSGVAGWQDLWGLRPGALVPWSVGAYTWTGAPAVGIFPGSAVGIVVRNATRAGSVNP